MTFQKIPLTKKIHRSGDCFCGAYSNRDEDLIDLQANYPHMYEKLMEIEEEVKEEFGEKDPRSYWANGGMDADSLYFDYETVGEGIVCSSCGVPGEDQDKGLFDY